MAEGILNPIPQLEAEFDFDVYTKQEVDALLDEKADKVDTYTKTEVDGLLDGKADADDVYTKTETDTLLSAKADKSTTLAGYGITDAYTKTETDNLLSAKADSNDVYTKTESDNKFAEKATTLAGYGITDAYTKTETDSALALKANIASPTFTGTPKAPTASQNDNSTKIATTAYVDTAVKVPADRLEKLIQILDGQIYDYKTVADVSYTKTVPAGAVEHANLDLIGGKTLVWNQLVDYTSIPSGSSANKLTFTNNNDGSFTFVGDSNAGAGSTYNVATVPNGHKFAVVGWTNPYKIQMYPTAQPVINSDGIYTQPNNNPLRLRFNDTTLSDGESVTLKPKIADLTLTFGSGNEPSTLDEFLAIFPDFGNATHNAGTLLSADVTEVVSKDAEDTTIDTYNIPADIQALSGYGWSCPNHYNYIDFENKTFVQEVDSRAYASGDESDATVITDGTNTYYALGTAVETDISAYLTDDTIAVESGGTLTMVNSHGDDYRIPIPNTETFMIDLEYALDH